MTTSWVYVAKDTTTFAKDEELPNLPVPPLEKTLTKYIQSVKPFVSEQELQETTEVVQQFLQGEGPKLQELLLEKAKKQKNWLEVWWEDLAYLTNRASLVPLLNMAGGFPIQHTNFPELEPYHPVALDMHYVLHFWHLLYKEKLRPHMSQNITWSMHQFRRLFNTTRIPGETKDSFSCYFNPESEGTLGPSHVIVLMEGHIFLMEALTEEGQILTPPQLADQLRQMEAVCRDLPPGPGLGILTTTTRDLWAKNRQHLAHLDPANREVLRLIDSALFVLAFDPAQPQDRTELFQNCLGGDLGNRWADKSLSFLFFKNGKLGANSDHAPFDGMVNMVLGHFLTLAIEEGYSDWKNQSDNGQPAAAARRLDFILDDYLRDQIQVARQESQARLSEVQVLSQSFTDYGKETIRPFRIKPEAYIQMGIHLGYYRLYQKFAPTYVTATTRKFYHGRTETVRSCLPEVMDWVHAMDDHSLSLTDRRTAFFRATNQMVTEMNDAMNNEGVDRHLLGLYMIAVENDFPIPTIFFDPSFVKSGGNGNYVLSTSLTGYTPLFGGVMPMRDDGYGIFYSILDEEFIFNMTTFASNPDTDCAALFSHLQEAFRDILALLTEERSRL